MGPLDRFSPSPNAELVRVRLSELQRLCRIELAAENLIAVLGDLVGKDNQVSMVQMEVENAYAGALVSQAVTELQHSVTKPT